MFTTNSFLSAIVADGLSVAFFFAVIAVVVSVYFWLDNLVNHLDLRKGWRPAACVLVSVFATIYLNAQIDHYRGLGAGYAGGEATTLALGWGVWMFLSGALLVGPFLLLFSSSDKKEKASGDSR